VLVDLQALNVIPKECLPEEGELPLESRRVWRDVTAAIHAKEFSRATKMKQGIEAQQRKAAATRKEQNEEWIPTYFVMDDDGGRPHLSDEGRKMLETVYSGN
jgi:hypothetical protein